MKRAVFCLLLLFSMAGFLFLGTGCGTLFQRENGATPVEFSQPGEASQPPAQSPLAVEVSKPQAVESQPVAAEMKPRPWYKRMWRRTPAPAVIPAAAEAPVPEAPEVKAPVAEAPAKPAPVVKPAPDADPAPVAVSNAPAGRRWYRFWGKSAPKAVPAVAPAAGKAAKPVPAMAGTEGMAAATNAPAARPWYRFWGRKGPAVEGAASEENPPEPPPEKGMFSPSGDPLIKPGYNLRMSVSAGGKMEMAEQVKTVSDKGDITLPLVGTVACEGKTVKELATQLEKLYEQYIRSPQASVEFVYSEKPGEKSPWGTVVVYGRVRQPGPVNIPPTRDLTLSRAIQFSGGALEDAKQSAIEVTRRNRDGSKTRIEIDLEAVAKRGESEKDIVLEHGDMVNVPRSTW